MRDLNGPKHVPCHAVALSMPCQKPSSVGLGGCACFQQILMQIAHTNRGIIGDELPVVYVVRHGEIAWSLSGQHTGLTDLPLTERGEKNALTLGKRLRGLQFSKVFTCPLKRASRTCELASFERSGRNRPQLGEMELRAIRRTPLVRDPGEAARMADLPRWLSRRRIARPDSCARRVRITRVRGVGANVLLFSSAHFLRVLAARCLGLDVTAGRSFVLGAASLSALSYEHELSQPVIQLWNDTQHIVVSNQA